MDRRSLVSCFIRHDSEILLHRRTNSVTVFPNRWDVPHGTFEDDPSTAAGEIVRQVTGERTSPSRIGDPLTMETPAESGAWLVHPVLFDIDEAIDPDGSGGTAREWVQPPAIRHRDCVPWLWPAYHRIAPTVGTVRSDTEHGAEYLSRRAVEVLRDRAGELVEDSAAQGESLTGDRSEWDELAELANALRDARPTMAVIRRRIDRVMYAAVADRRPEAVERIAIGLLGGLADTAARIGETARSSIAADRIGTLSTSATVRETVAALEPAHVLIPESRPGGEGVAFATRLHDDGHPVSLTTDAAFPWLVAIGGVDTVIVGADSVLADGTVVNKVGTFGTTTAATASDIPVYVVAHTDKITPATTVETETAPAETVGDGGHGLPVENPLFDRTPGRLVTGLVTERGVLTSQEVRKVADRARVMAGWREKK